MYAEFYKKHIKDAVVSGNLTTGLCPFHDDSKQSFSAFNDSGLWACFGSCNLKGKPPEEFVARIKGVSLGEAYQILADEGITKTKRGPGRPKKEETATEEPDKEVPIEEVNLRHEALLSNLPAIQELADRRGWTLEAIKEHRVGWDFRDDRIWLPVFNGEGTCVDVRRYDWHHQGKQKFLPFATGYGKNRLWPIPAERLTPETDLILFEGEPDTMLALSMGLPAVSFTGGAGSEGRIKGRNLTIVYDLDDAGAKGAAKRVASLKNSFKNIRVMALPPWEGMPKNADFTDWVKNGNGIEQFMALMRDLWTAPAYADVSLPEAVKSARYNTTMQVAAVASGKNLSPFQVPKTGLVSCPQGMKCCRNCGIEASGGMHTFEVQADSPKLIECANEPSTKLRGILREHLGIPKVCVSNEIEVTSVQNMYDVKLTSMIDMEQQNEKTPYIAIQAWSTQDLELNTPFILTAKAMPDPKTQAGTLLITHIKSGHTRIDEVVLDEETIQQLKAFQPEEATRG